MGCIVVITGQVGIPLESLALQIITNFETTLVINREKEEPLRDNLARRSFLEKTSDISVLILTRKSDDIIFLEEQNFSVKAVYFEANLYSRKKESKRLGKEITFELEKNWEQEILRTRADVVCNLDKITELQISTSTLIPNIDKLFSTIKIHSSKKKLK